MTDDEVASTWSLFEERELAEGAVLYDQGDAADALYVVLEGQVQVSRDGRVVGEIGPGASLGERSIFLGSTARSVKALAASPVTVLRISRESFHAALNRRVLPALFVANLAHELATRLSR